jgi:stringent starvation protein B
MAPVVHHPLQTILDVIWNAGHTPKLVVDSTHEDVVAPEHVKAQWKEWLQIDLCASYPLNLDYSKEGVSVDLAFSGSTCRCFFPWARITMVVDRETGEGVALKSPGAAEPMPKIEAKPARAWTPKVLKGGKS